MDSPASSNWRRRRAARSSPLTPPYDRCPCMEPIVAVCHARRCPTPVKPWNQALVMRGFLPVLGAADSSAVSAS